MILSEQTEFERRNKMKKLITLLLTLTIIASVFILPSAAITESDAMAWKYTLLMQSSNSYSLTGDDTLFYAKYAMRGMAVSQDGKYIFGGYLNPSGSSAIEMFETATGKVVAGYQYIQPDNNTASYPKGLATDDRGYLYAALAWNPNNTRADLAVIDYSNNTLKQIGYANILTTDANTKTGVNGITVQNINGSYYAYVVVNYDVDYLARFDVNDPTNPVLDTSFGEGGLIDLQKDPYNLSEANYLDVDTDGTIYLSCNTKTDKVVYVLSPDGSLILNTLVHDTAYGVALWGDYLFVTTQKTGKVGIYDKKLLIPVANIEVNIDTILLPIDRDDILINAGVNSMCNATVVNDILFLGDQGVNTTGLDQVFAVGLTAEAAATVASWADAIAARLDAAYPAETDPPATNEAPNVTDEPTDAPDVTDEPTDAPEATDAPTDAPEQTPAPGTDAPDEKKGCGGMVAGIAFIAIIGTAVVIRKKD